MFQLPDREFVVDETASKEDLLIVIDYLAKEIEGMRERQLRRLSIPLPGAAQRVKWFRSLIGGEQN